MKCAEKFCNQYQIQPEEIPNGIQGGIPEGTNKIMYSHNTQGNLGDSSMTPWEILRPNQVESLERNFSQI